MLILPCSGYGKMKLHSCSMPLFPSSYAPVSTTQPLSLMTALKREDGSYIWYENGGNELTVSISFLLCFEHVKQGRTFTRSYGHDGEEEEEEEEEARGRRMLSLLYFRHRKQGRNEGRKEHSHLLLILHRCCVLSAHDPLFLVVCRWKIMKEEGMKEEGDEARLKEEEDEA